MGVPIYRWMVNEKSIYYIYFINEYKWMIWGYPYNLLETTMDHIYSHSQTSSTAPPRCPWKRNFGGQPLIHVLTIKKRLQSLIAHAKKVCTTRTTITMLYHAENIASKAGSDQGCEKKLFLRLANSLLKPTCGQVAQTACCHIGPRNVLHLSSVWRLSTQPSKNLASKRRGKHTAPAKKHAI